MEYLNNAHDQLKRLDHSVYVSLKYTRTVDVLRSILNRMVDTITPLLDTLLAKAKADKKIEDLPTNIPLKCKAIRGLYADNERMEELTEMLDFLMFIRKVRRAEDYEKINEYRRHVALITEIDGEEVEINLDIIHEYYDKTKAYLLLVDEVVFGKKDDD